MPKIKLQVPFEAFSGAIMDDNGNSGQVCFSSPRGGLVSRRWTRPTQPYSVMQTLTRNYTIACSQAYQALTKIQGDAWQTAAALVSRLDQLGNAFTLAGLSYYNLVNWYRLAHKQAQSAVVPATEFPAKTQILTSVTRKSATLLTFTGTTVGADITRVFVRFTDPLPGHSSHASRNQLSVNTTEIEMDENFLAVAGNAFSADIKVTDSKFTAADNIGVGIIGLNAAYQSTDLYFIPNIALI
jgi:hypothetical protein